MKRYLIIFLVITLLPLLTSAQKNGKREKIEIEIFGGYSFLNPDHLNLWSVYREGRADFYRTQQYDYNHSMNGDYYTYSGEAEGRFKTIKGSFPFGARVKVNLNSSLAISLGMEYIHGEQRSRVISEYKFNTYYSGKYSLKETTDPLEINFEGFVPAIGISYNFNNSPGFRFGGYLNLGVVFASTGMTFDYHFRRETEGGYFSESETIYQYTGKGTGLNMEVGVRMDVDISGPVGFFTEAGYSYRKVKKITGDGRYKYAVKDSNSDGYSIENYWTGTWIITDGKTSREWGDWNYSYFYPYPESPDSRRFILDLSGFYLRIGISLKF